MIEFKEVSLKDREWIQPLLDASSYRSAEYSFNFIYLWRSIFAYKVGRVGNYFVLKSMRENHPVSYLFPAGFGDIKPVLDALDTDAASHGIPLIFHTVLEEARDVLEAAWPHEFEYIELSDYADYIYESERMQKLNGKKLASKRNHINRFMENNPNWSYEPITKDNLPEVVAMNQAWYSIEEEEDQSKSFDQESQTVDQALHEFLALEAKGGLLRAEGKVVAFTIGDRVTKDTMLIHIEKAFKEVQGAYPMINQQFALDAGKDYTFINREDDSGHPGLRRAKESYQPIFMVKKYGAKRLCDDEEGGRGDGQPCYQ